MAQTFAEVVLIVSDAFELEDALGAVDDADLDARVGDVDVVGGDCDVEVIVLVAELVVEPGLVVAVSRADFEL